MNPGVTGWGMIGYPTVTPEQRAAMSRAERIRDAAPELLEACKFILSHINDPERKPRDLYPAFGLNASRAKEILADAILKAEEGL